MELNRESYIDYSDEVRTALREGRAVVALESTIISHGMPYPENISTARQVEAIVRNEGAAPATIAIVSGRIKVGLSSSDMEIIGDGKGSEKVSRRDIPSIVARGGSGGTTVASTMIFAEMAGIPIFATGGIGGVHRGGERTFDISADLQELGRTNVAVVSAGAKAILDLPLTIEYLETLGVPVYGYRTDEFPSFYSRYSGLPVTTRLNTPEEVADVLALKWGLGVDGGVLIASPIPEESSLDVEEVERAVEEALSDAERRGISGKSVTPFLLGEIEKHTGGRSLESNIALICNNAKLAARVAIAYTNEARADRS